MARDGLAIGVQLEGTLALPLKEVVTFTSDPKGGREPGERLAKKTATVVKADDKVEVARSSERPLVGQG